MGLEPTGENGTYFQSVPLRSLRPDEKQTTPTIELGGKPEAFLFCQDFISGGDAGRAETSVEAPVGASIRRAATVRGHPEGALHRAP
jgi:hypothetical protein